MKNGMLCVAMSTLAACVFPQAGSGGATAGAQAHGGEAWLKEMLAREATLPPAQKVDSGDGAFEAVAPGTLAGEIVKGEGYYFVSFSIGTDSPVECWVHLDGLDMAASAVQLSKTALESLAEMHGPIADKVIGGLGADVVEGRPLLKLEYLYAVDGKAGKLAGLAKFRTGRAAGGTLQCIHNELGYRKTFDDFYAQLIRSLRFGAPLEPEAYYEAVSLVEINQQPLGIAHVTLVRDADGDTKVVQRNSMLIARDAQSVTSNDSYHVQFTDEEGRLINQVDVESENGELNTNLQLNPAEGGGWQVKGIFESKPLEARIESKDVLTSWVGDALKVRAALKKGGALSKVGAGTWRTLTFVASANPTQLTEWTMKRTGTDGEGRAVAKGRVGPIEAEFVFDADGTSLAEVVRAGPATIDSRRKFVRGSF